MSVCAVNEKSPAPGIHYEVLSLLFMCIILFCLKGGVKHSNNHSPNIITYHLQYISPLYDGRNATVIL